MNKKLFLAFSAVDPLQVSFVPTLKKLKINAEKKAIEIRWVPLNLYHVTISYLGERDENVLPVLEKAMRDVCAEFSPFEVKVEDVGAFADEHEARVLWLGVQNKKVLREFKFRLDQILINNKILFQQDNREFVPHLTIGRLRNPRSVKDMISPFKRKSFDCIHVNELILFESKQQGAHPVYIPLFRVELTGASVIEDC